MTGAAVACLFLVLGFALFGKNLLNVWFIVAGVYLYSRFKSEPFATHINTAFFGLALAPIFSEILFSTSFRCAVSLPLSIATGLVIGFVLAARRGAAVQGPHGVHASTTWASPRASWGRSIVALYKSYGFVPDPVFIWTTGNNAAARRTFLTVVFAVDDRAPGFCLDRSLSQDCARSWACRASRRATSLRRRHRRRRWPTWV